MFGVAVVLVLGSGFLHSVWNLYAKKSLDKNVFLWLCQCAAFLLFLPWAVVEWDRDYFSGTTLLVLAVSMGIHALYMKLLAATYSIGDLSQVYPIMRGTSPLLVPLLGVAVFHESLSALGWISIVLIVIGIVLLSNVTYRRVDSVSFKAPLLAFAVGLCIAGYIVYDKFALRYVSPVVLMEATNLGNLLVLTWASLRSGRIRNELRINWKTALIGGLIAPGGYLLFLYALSLAPVAQLAPMREIGTVFGTLMGIFILREKQGARRIVTSVLITAGVIMLGLWG